jgi:hypothetical protein
LRKIKLNKKYFLLKTMLNMDQLKQYLAINDNSQDFQISIIIKSVESFVKNSLNPNFLSPNQIPEDLTLAMMNHAAYYYNNSLDNSKNNQLPSSVTDIYRKYKTIRI